MLKFLYKLYHSHILFYACYIQFALLVAIIRCERDSLLGENERLCFQLQMMSEVIQSSSRDNRQQSSIQKYIIFLVVF